MRMTDENLKMFGLRKFGFYLNGEKELKTVWAKNEKFAKRKLDLFYPDNFNIQIKEI